MRRCCSFVLSIAVLSAIADAETGDDDRRSLRRPVALAHIGDTVLVANRDSGTISLIDAEMLNVVGEFRAGRRLSDLEAVPGTSIVLAADREQNELIVLRVNGSSVSIAGRAQTPSTPVDIAVAPDGRRCSVVALWAQQIALFAIDQSPDASRLAAPNVIDLPFAPREQCFLPDGRLLVAAAFGDRMALIDPTTGSIDRQFRIPGHNVRGMAVDPTGTEIRIAHQTLTDFIPTTRNDVFWGHVLSNVLRSIQIDRLGSSTSAPDREPELIHGSLIPLGRERNGAADPDAVALLSDGTPVVCLAGVNEVAVHTHRHAHPLRASVGRRPVDVAIDPDGHRVWIANMFDDSVSLFDTQSMSVDRTILLGPSRKPTELERGEILFHDASLSLDGWFSCHSCHTDGHTCEQLNDNFGDDSYGAPKRIPSLLGTRGTAPWGWTGNRATLSEQVSTSIATTMRHPKPEQIPPRDIAALVAYVRSLEPPPSLQSARGHHDQTEAFNGARLFDRLGCADCHGKPNHTSDAVFDVGLVDALGTSRFNPPSLRGVSQRRRLFHDGRADGVRDVIVRIRHQLDGPLPAKDTNLLERYLLSL